MSTKLDDANIIKALRLAAAVISRAADGLPDGLPDGTTRAVVENARLRIHNAARDLAREAKALDRWTSEDVQALHPAFARLVKQYAPNFGRKRA